MTNLGRSTRGDPDVRIAMVDGRVDVTHPALRDARVEVHDQAPGSGDPAASAHATFIASMFAGAGGAALGLCPDCTLVNVAAVDHAMLSTGSATPVAAERLAAAVGRAASAQADVILLALEMRPTSAAQVAVLVDAIGDAARRGVRTVVAAGNSGRASDSPLLTACGSVPVGMAGDDGAADPQGSWGPAVGARGLLAPGRGIPGAAPGGVARIASGSSYAAGFVVAAFGLLRAVAPGRSTGDIWEELCPPTSRRARRSLMPPPLDADAAAIRLQVTTDRGARDGR